MVFEAYQSFSWHRLKLKNLERKVKPKFTEALKQEMRQKVEAKNEANNKKFISIRCIRVMTAVY